MIVLNVEPSWVSPYVFACFVTLTEKGVPFEARVLDASAGDTRAGDYLERTVTGRVPTLEHDGFGLGESSAIVEYIDDVFPEPPLLPREPKQRGRARQLMSWARSDDTAAIRSERPALGIFYERAVEPLSEDAKASAAKLFEIIERVLPAGAGHVFGAFTIVDAELAFLLQRLVSSGDPVPERLAAWARAIWARPSICAYADRPRPPLPAGA